MEKTNNFFKRVRVRRKSREMFRINTENVVMFCYNAGYLSKVSFELLHYSFYQSLFLLMVAT